MGRLSLKDLQDILRCPRSRQSIEVEKEQLRSGDGRHTYGFDRGVPDLRHPPDRLSIDVPWYQPWDELDDMDPRPPKPLDAPDLPYHLDRHLAGAAGPRGDGRWILEVGCGERQCEAYFAARDFNYVGVDADVRGPGPNVLADAHNLPFADESFDLCVSLAVYQHLQMPLAAAAEAQRVLKPGGRFFGSSAFVYGWTDKASFFHMSHGGLLMLLRSVGFEDVRVWSDWAYNDSIANMSFNERGGAPWRIATENSLKFLEWTFTRTSGVARRLTGKEPLDTDQRAVQTAGSLSFMATRT